MTEAELLEVIAKAARENATFLDLSGKGIKTIPPEIGKLTNLTELDLSYNYITDIPEAITKLTNLTTLNLDNNLIREISDEITMLTNLTFLSISHNLNDRMGLRLSESIDQFALRFNNQISVIPDTITKLANLTTLNLSGNEIDTISNRIGELTNLSILNLDDNQIRSIPDAITKLTNLTTLNLSANKITKIPDAIAELSNLQTLVLGGNQIRTITKNIKQLSSLKHLDLSENEIAVIPDEISQLSSLQELSVGANKINIFPDEITKLANLRILYLDRNEISDIPDEIVKLSSLQHLDLSYSRLRNIPDIISQLANLRRIDISNNYISLIPESLCKLTYLNYLSLSFNEITQIPEVIGNLTSLNSLELNGNQIAQIPEAIGNLSSLIFFNLNGNQITQIPEAISKLASLTSLYLSNNRITQIPEVIGNLPSLTSLEIGHNQITQIPEAIGKLTSLTSLYLSDSQITQFPEVIGKLTSLTSLELSSNQITQIPEVIGNLRNLTSLYLSENQITRIPEATTKLTNLKKLDLRYNPLPIPVEILEDYRNPAAILSYWQKLKQGERKPLNEAKVILVGRGDVGKTSLVKRLIDKEFNANEPKTEGINIREWQVSAREEKVRLRVWDFGGQEIMHATHQFFLTERSLYVLVLNTRKDERISDVEYWLKLIQTFGKDAPILIVGNKCDETGFDLDEKGLRDKYGENIKQFIPTSCKDGTGIETLRQEIIQQIAQMDHVFDLLPQQWFAVKTKLEQSQADYIPYYEYQQLCQQEKITDSIEQSRLIKLLHDLGVILNFQDNPRLKEPNVLKPDWVTKGVYKILNNNELMTEHKGRLEWKTCQSILTDDCYREDQEKLFILDMMKKFKLSFPLDTTPDIPTYLIPDLLPKSEPYTGQWQDTLNFEYHYGKILPSSVISRFIVKTYHKIARLSHPTYWRTGVILASKDGNHAYVRADLEDATIFIRISGNLNTRRSFLTYIRETFDEIHDDPPKLSPDERVALPDNPKLTVSYEHLLSLERRGKTECCPEGSDRDYNIRDLLDGVEERRLRNPNSRNPDPKIEPEGKIKSMKTILLLAANPKNTNSLRLQEEERDIKERLRLNGYGTDPIKSAVAVRSRDLNQALLDFDPQIIHFSGHGGGEDGLAFEEIDGTLKLISGQALAGLFSLFSDRLECVVLNACYSEVQAQAIAQHIDYVIGMDRAIKDKSAIEFAVGFYSAIGAGKDYEFAFKMGCNAIDREGLSEQHIPQLLKKS